MQAGLCWNAKTVEFVRLNDDHRVAATHHYSLRLTCGCETDNPAEPCFGFLDRPYGAFDRILEEESGVASSSMCAGSASPTGRSCPRVDGLAARWRHRWAVLFEWSRVGKPGSTGPAWEYK